MFSMFRVEKGEALCFRSGAFLALVGQSLANKRMPTKLIVTVTVKYISTCNSRNAKKKFDKLF